MKKPLKSTLGKAAAALFLLVFVIGPLALYAVLMLGWPPVIGNLTAAHAMRIYFAQAHPGWEPEGCWAGYNLVDGCYSLDFIEGGERHSLSCDLSGGRMIRDREREDALRTELEIDRALRLHGLLRKHIYWGAGWDPREPEAPRISLRRDCYDPPGAPILSEEVMREQMADRAMEVHEAMSPVTPIHTIYIHYCHQGVERKGGGLRWNSIRVDLPGGAALTREQVLAAPLTVK